MHDAFALKREHITGSAGWTLVQPPRPVCFSRWYWRRPPSWARVRQSLKTLSTTTTIRPLRRQRRRATTRVYAAELTRCPDGLVRVSKTRRYRHFMPETQSVGATGGPSPGAKMRPSASPCIGSSNRISMRLKTKFLSRARASPRTQERSAWRCRQISRGRINSTPLWGSLCLSSGQMVAISPPIIARRILATKAMPARWRRRVHSASFPAPPPHCLSSSELTRFKVRSPRPVRSWTSTTGSSGHLPFTTMEMSRSVTSRLPILLPRLRHPR